MVTSTFRVSLHNVSEHRYTAVEHMKITRLGEGKETHVQLALFWTLECLLSYVFGVHTLKIF